MNLRDYMYLDSDRLQNYMASLDPGTVKELADTQRQQTGGEGKAGLSVPGFGEAGGGGSHERENSQQRSMEVTYQHMFDRLYTALDKEGDIKTFDEEQALPTGEVKKKEVVEVTRDFNPSPMNELIDKVFELMDMMKRFGFVEEVNDQETQEAVQGLAMVFRGEEGREEVPMVARAEEDDDSSVVFVAKSRFLMADQSDFQGELTLFGRVSKLIPSGESLDLFDFLKIPRELARDANTKKEIISMFETWPKELGGPVSKDSLRVPGPVVIVTPVAVYEA